MTTIVSKSSPVLDLETLWPAGCVVFRVEEVVRLKSEDLRLGDYMVVQIGTGSERDRLVAVEHDGRRLVCRGEDLDGDRVIGRVVGLVRNYLE